MTTTDEIVRYALTAAEIAERIGEVGYARKMLAVVARVLDPASHGPQSMCACNVTHDGPCGDARIATPCS